MQAPIPFMTFVLPMGVIIITTKKGRSGKTNISYDFYVEQLNLCQKGLEEV